MTNLLVSLKLSFALLIIIVMLVNKNKMITKVVQSYVTSCALSKSKSSLITCQCWAFLSKAEMSLSSRFLKQSLFIEDQNIEFDKCIKRLSLIKQTLLIERDDRTSLIWPNLKKFTTYVLNWTILWHLTQHHMKHFWEINTFLRLFRNNYH